MWFNFLLKNFNLFTELIGALVFFIVAWFLWDSFRAAKQAKFFLRAFGFELLFVCQIIRAVSLSSEIVNICCGIAGILGLLFIFISFLLDMPPPKIASKVILVLPAFSVLQPSFQKGNLALGFLISVLILRNLRIDVSKALKNFVIAFWLLAVSFGFEIYAKTPFSLIGGLGLLIKLLAFIFFFAWVWQYLKLRLGEELVLIFVALAFLIAIFVTIAFSFIFLKNLQQENNRLLGEKIKVLNALIDDKKDHALLEAKSLAGDSEIKSALKARDLLTLNGLIKSKKEKEKLDFINIADPQGEILLRTNAPVKKSETITQEKGALKSLNRESVVNIEKVYPEGLSIRASVPIIENEELLGVMVNGFVLDNTFADRMKDIFSTDVDFYDKDNLEATTISQKGSRINGTKQGDETVNKAVLENKGNFIGEVKILDQFYFASFIPINDLEGNTTGMKALLFSQSSVFNTVNNLSNLTLIVVGAIMVVLIIPVRFLANILTKSL